MNISLDFDGTYTSDPRLWDIFITSAAALGHNVTVVTMRHPHESIDCLGNLPIIYMRRLAKQQFVEAQGLKFDIWIDDNPYWILHNSVEVAR